MKPRDLRSLIFSASILNVSSSCSILSTCFLRDNCPSKTILYSVWRYSLPWPDQNANGCKNVEIRGCSTSIEVFDLASHNIQAIDSFWSNDWVLQVVLGGNSIILRLSTLRWASQLFMIRATFLPCAWNFKLSFLT